MDEARLAEIERLLGELNEEQLQVGLGGGVFALDGERTDALLIAASVLRHEVRRLKKAVDGAYSDGESSREADITCILGDAEDDGVDDTETLRRIKATVGWTEEEVYPDGPRLLAFIDLTKEPKI